MTDIAILGSGNIGGTLARRWAQAGHDLTLGVRDAGTERVRALVDELGGAGVTVSALPIEEAIASAPVAVVAVPGPSVPTLLESVGGALAGRVVVDTTNDMTGTVAHHAGAFTQHAPQAIVYRAFNTLGWENFAEPDHDGEAADLFYCGADDGLGRGVVEGLIRDVGLGPVYVGGLDQADVLDGVLRLWFAVAVQQGRGRHTAFKVLPA
jgi:8-hydroxy-5-deazaflavin:NADPH oxidoreductase